MAFTAKDLASSDHFLTAILRCANELIAIYKESPRIASIFAAQQRWLMAHAGFALYYGYPDEPGSALYAARFVSLVLKQRIASRNTAVAFIQEMLAYRFLRPLPEFSDRRTRLLEPTETANEHLMRWVNTHLFILDHLDGGNRVERMAADSSALAVIQSEIAKRIFQSEAVRNPGATFNLFNWANSGGVVMDYLISRIESVDPESERVVIGPISLKNIREQFLISNTHLKRLLREAGVLGSVGWTGVPGKSGFWLSHGFVTEYWNYQAAKFAIIDAASEIALGPGR
ncbi:hypothetical protein [Rhizobium tubonense]|uniref:Uncharacterized protein n=1 Tax=Rhizobium tubonense TaxID=484088 RepID=A0A2W4EHY3_9HYPH|nr:hypothetical protein [Rhizobium tubonense]PZM13736.1 hypothetical protein CPY51_12705 [Rhizobium tubonense]